MTGSNFFKICLLAVLIVGCAPKKEAPPPQQGPMPVPVGHPEVRKVLDWDEYTGRFESPTKVDVRARVSGYLQGVHFEDGQEVNKGDVLFTIDKRPFQIDVALMQAQLKQVEAQAMRAKNDYDRALKLKESNAISTEELDQREQTMYATQAQVEAAKVGVDQARLYLEYTDVQAPIDGHVGRDLVNEGNLITGGNAGPTISTTLLTTIVSDSPIYFYFEASESDLLNYQRHNMEPSIEKGSGKTPIYVKLLDEDDYVHKGEVDFMDNEIDHRTGTIQMRAVFTNEDGFIQSGMFGRARLPAGESYRAVLVKDELVRSNQSQKFVYTIGEDSTVQPTPVELGRLQTDGMRVIKSGLTIDSVIITGKTQMLRPGIPVSPQTGDGQEGTH